jgi:hypothetical protein
MIAPMCHICGSIVSPSAGGLKIITAVAATNITKPYMVKRCAILRLVLQNSPERATSSTAVLIAIETFSPPSTVLVALS